MSTVETVKDVLGKREEEFKNNPTHKKFMERYLDLIERGIIKKKQYNIPPTDTIGARRCRRSERENN